MGAFFRRHTVRAYTVSLFWRRCTLISFSVFSLSLCSIMHGLYSRTTSWSMASQLLSLRSGNITLAAYTRRQQFGGAITTLGMIQLGGVIDNWTITNKRHTRTYTHTHKN